MTLKKKKKLSFHVEIIKESERWLKVIIFVPKKGIIKEMYFSKRQIEIKRLYFQKAVIKYPYELSVIDGIA